MKLPSFLRKKQNINKTSSVAPLISLTSTGNPIWTPRKYDQLAREGYEKNVVVYRCVEEITSAAQAQWKLFRIDSQGRRIEIEDRAHPLLKLMRRPNPQQGGVEFHKKVIAFHEIAGNTYIESVGPENGPPVELYCLRPDRMAVVPGKVGVQSYKYTVNGHSKLFPVDFITGQSEILHLKTFHPTNDWYGMSRLEAAAFDIDIHNAVLGWNKALLDNSARPSGAIKYTPPANMPGSLTDAEFNRLKAQIDEDFTGAGNQGRPMLFEGYLSWEQISLSPQDMDYINSKNTSARDIASAFNVPPVLLGISGDSTYNNQKEARLALWEDTNLPLLYKIRDSYNNWLTPQFGDDLRLEIDEDRISALSPRRDAAWERARTADFLTINEKRELVNFSPVEGGDKVLVNAGLLPIDFDFSEPKEADKFQTMLEDSGHTKQEAEHIRKLVYGT